MAAHFSEIGVKVSSRTVFNWPEQWKKTSEMFEKIESTLPCSK